MVIWVLLSGWSSEYFYHPAGHVLTGDLGIIKDRPLWKLISKGPSLDQGWVMAFPHVSLIFRGVEHNRPSLNPFCFSENFFASFSSIGCWLIVTVTWKLPKLKVGSTLRMTWCRGLVQNHSKSASSTYKPTNLQTYKPWTWVTISSFALFAH